MFSVVLAAIMLAGVLIGFAPTFFLRSYFGGPALPPLLILHGVTLTAWYGLFLAQTSLAASGQLKWHRRLGWAAAVVAIMFLVTGPAVVIRSVPRGLASGLTPIELAFVVLTDVLRLPLFAVLVGSAIWFRRRRDVHKRALLLASLSNFAPAVARAGMAVQVHPLVSAFAYVAAFGAAMLVDDRRTLGRVHPLTRWGIVTLFAVMLVPIALIAAGAAGPVVDALR